MQNFASRTGLFLLLMGLTCACHQHPDVPEQVPYGPSPATPPQAALEAVCGEEIEALTRHEVEGEGGSLRYYFTIGGERFTGWACQEIPDNNHRYRYTKYDDGWPVWKVGYYANGQPDLDFHMQRGGSLGSERMWRSDGDPYIDYFYSDVDHMHGKQRRWHANGAIAFQAEYNKGELIYEIRYDGKGSVLDLKGDVPKPLLNGPPR